MIYVVAFDPINIMTCWALQNDCQTSVLWKLLIKLANKWPEKFVKWPFYIYVIFISKQSLVHCTLDSRYCTHSENRHILVIPRHDCYSSQIWKCWSLKFHYTKIIVLLSATICTIVFRNLVWWICRCIVSLE